MEGSNVLHDASRQMSQWWHTHTHMHAYIHIQTSHGLDPLIHHRCPPLRTLHDWWSGNVHTYAIHALHTPYTPYIRHTRLHAIHTPSTPYIRHPRLTYAIHALYTPSTPYIRHTRLTYAMYALHTPYPLPLSWCIHAMKTLEDEAIPRMGSNHEGATMRAQCRQEFI